MSIKKLIVMLALATPLALTPGLTSGASVNAATTANAKFSDHVLVNTNSYKHAKVYHAKTTTLRTYQAAFMADQPVVSFGKAKTIKPAQKLAVDQKIVVKVSHDKIDKLLKDKKAYQAAKQATYFHVKKIGWVKASAIAK